MPVLDGAVVAEAALTHVWLAGGRRGGGWSLFRLCFPSPLFLCEFLVRAARATERLVFFFFVGGCWGVGREGREVLAAALAPMLTVMFAVN